MCLELDMPSRTTRDYREPAVAPRYQAALEAALTPQETEISVNAAPSPADARYRVKASRTEQPSGLVMRAGARFGVRASRTEQPSGSVGAGDAVMDQG